MNTKNPYAIEILLELMAYRSLVQAQDPLAKNKGISDIIKMHAFANQVYTKPDVETTHFVLIDTPDGGKKRKRIYGKTRLRP